MDFHDALVDYMSSSGAESTVYKRWWSEYEGRQKLANLRRFAPQLDEEDFLTDFVEGLLGRLHLILEEVSIEDSVEVIPELIDELYEAVSLCDVTNAAPAEPFLQEKQAYANNNYAQAA